VIDSVGGATEKTVLAIARFLQLFPVIVRKDARIVILAMVALRMRNFFHRFFVTFGVLRRLYSKECSLPIDPMVEELSFLYSEI